MQWKIKLEFTPDGGETITREIGSITRPIADLRPEEIGLTLAEGQELGTRYRAPDDQRPDTYLYALLSPMHSLRRAAALQRHPHEVRSDCVWGLSLSGA